MLPPQPSYPSLAPPDVTTKTRRGRLTLSAELGWASAQTRRDPGKTPDGGGGPLVPSGVRPEFIRGWVWRAGRGAGQAISSVDWPPGPISASISSNPRETSTVPRRVQERHPYRVPVVGGSTTRPLRTPRAMPDAEKAWRANIPKMLWAQAGAPFGRTGCLS